MEYVPGTPPNERYSAAQEEQFVEYVGSIVVLSELEDSLSPDFLHIDGALVFDSQDRPVVQNISAETGKRPFIDGFRAMIDRQAQADGEIQGTWLPEGDYASLEEEVLAQLPVGTQIQGNLVAAAAVTFPYRLREGGDPLELPPPLQGQIEAREQLLRTPITATGNAELDHHDVNAIQAVYADAETGLVTARVGLVWDDHRAVPFAIMRQTLERRGQLAAAHTDTPQRIVEKLTQAI